MQGDESCTVQAFNAQIHPQTERKAPESLTLLPFLRLQLWYILLLQTWVAEITQRLRPEDKIMQNNSQELFCNSIIMANTTQ